MNEHRTTPGTDASFANFGEVLPASLEFDKLYWMVTEHLNDEGEWEEQIDMTKVIKSGVMIGGDKIEITAKVMGQERTVIKTSPRVNDKLIWVIGNPQTAGENAFPLRKLAKCKFFGPITCSKKETT